MKLLISDNRRYMWIIEKDDRCFEMDMSRPDKGFQPTDYPKEKILTNEIVYECQWSQETTRIS